MIRSRTRSSSRPGTTVASSARASSWSSPSSRSSGRPGKRRSSLGSRTREHDRDRLGEQPARDEPEHLRGGLVEPLEVVDDAQQRLLLGDLRQQAERGQADEEAVGRRAGREAERDPQRVLLRLRERVEAVEQRRAELMQPGERQLHLGLDAGDLQRPGSPAAWPAA